MVLSKKSVLPVYVTLFYIFLYLPIIVLTFYSFNAGEFPSAWKGFSLVWYKELFHSTEIWLAFKTSAIVSVCAALLSCSLATTLIYGVRKSKFKIESLFYANILVPDIVLAVGLLGLFSYFLVPLGYLTLIAGHTVLGLGFAIPIIKARFDELNVSLIEASRDLGATSMYTFLHVVIPFLFPSLLVSALLVMIVSFDDFLISFFCSGSSAQTLSLYIFTMIRSGISPTVNALSTLMLVISTLFVLAISLVHNRWETEL